MLTFKPSSTAVTAEVFEAQGKCFDADLHIVEIPGDAVSANWTQMILDKYADKVIAYHIAPVFDTNTFVIELQFDDTPEGRAVAHQCLREYRSGYAKGGYVPRKKKAANAKARGSGKRLYKHRMYRLPDGTLFWYYARWDHHGNAVGKVEVFDRPRNDGIPLENRIISRSELLAATLIPKGQEPWRL